VNNLSKAFALSVVIALTGCAEDDPQQFLKEGYFLVEKGDLKSARVQFKSALQMNPKLADAYYGLALLDEKEKDFQAMRRNLLEVIGLNSVHVEAHVKLGFLLINQLGKAKEHSAIALKYDSDNNDVVLLDARIYYEEGKYKDAQQRIERVLEKDPSHVEAIWLKATMLLAKKDNDLAEVVIDQGIERNPGNIELGTLKVKLHKTQKKFDEVINDYEVLTASHPDNKALRLELVNVLILYGEPKQVEVAINKVIEKYPEDIGLKLAFIKYLQVKGYGKRIEGQLNEFISVSPVELKLKFRLVQLYLSERRYTEARTLLLNMISIDPEGKDGLDAKVQLAEIAWAEKDKSKADKLVDEVLVSDVGNTLALMFRAKLKLSKKDADGAISDLRIVLRDQFEVGKAMVMMAEAHKIKGELEVAESFWRKALVEKPDNVSAIMPLSAMLLKRGDNARAEELLIKAIKSSPSNLVVRELLIRFRVSKKDWIGAKEAADDLGKQPKGLLIANTLKAMLAEKQEHYDEAIQIYTNVFEKKPNSKTVLASLARVYASASRSADYLVFIKGFVSKYPDNVGVHNELGRIYAQGKKWDKAEAVLQQVLEKEVFSLEAYRLMVGVLEHQGKSEEVVNLLRNASLKRPDQPMLMNELAKYLTRKQQREEAIIVYEKILKKYPDLSEAANNLADLLLSTHTDQVRLSQALELTMRFKGTDNPYYLDTYGWALFKNGDVKNAITVLNKSVAILPGNIVFNNHLQEALKQAKGKNEVLFDEAK